MFQDLIYEVKGPIAYITMNRPTQLNALSVRLVKELKEAALMAESQENVAVVILRGEGRAFSAGYDIQEETETVWDSPVEWRNTLKADIDLALTYWNLSIPVIAAVQGYCLGGACELAMACDITVASDDAVFGEPEIRYGSGPVALIMPWVVGMKRTKELLYTGDLISATDALQYDMVSRVVAREQLDASTEALALKIARTPVTILRLTKRPINQCFEFMGLLSGIQYNLEISTTLNGAKLPEQEEFDAIAKRDGLKIALKWRDSRFGESLSQTSSSRRSPSS
ncbi:MAG: enoyl-CoA hydratase-related protein [Firmicutes bacterium]|nr:enoyl-CoA hydratase-related protein [Bacillota bacterium]